MHSGNGQFELADLCRAALGGEGWERLGGPGGNRVTPT